MFKYTLVLCVLVLSACTTVQNDAARCRTTEDDAARRACLERVSAERDEPGEDGVGPPTCHPASTRPDADRDRC